MSKLLLLIDFQHGFLRPGLDTMTANVKRAVASPLFSKVIATQFINAPGGPWHTILQWHGLETPAEQKLAVDLPPTSSVFTKTTYSLPQSILEKIAAEWSPGSIYVAGLETDVCVAVIAAQLFDIGAAPLILADCTGTTKGEEHQKHALITLGRMVGRDRLTSLQTLESPTRESGKTDFSSSVSSRRKH